MPGSQTDCHQAKLVYRRNLRVSSEKPVLVILEDDEELAEELVYAVEEAGYAATACYDIESFWKHVGPNPADILVIDLSLPDGSGVDVVREVRASSQVPIVITSGKAEVEDRIACIEAGADDYLVKPYNSREVIAKLARLLTRTRGTRYSRQIAQLAGQEVLEFDIFSLDTQSMALETLSGIEVPLTTFEFLTLKTLLNRPNTLLSRASIIDVLHSDRWVGSERTIDNLISRLRRKFADHSQTKLIKSVRGVGYILTADVTRKTG